MKQNVIKFLFRQILNLESISKAMADRKKREKEKIEKSEYLKNNKSFLDEIKNIFHNF